MRRKNFLLAFSAAFFIALLAVATAPTTAAPTNNWGVEADTTLNYKIEWADGDHSTTYGYEITVVNIEDLSSPTDDLDDLFYTWQENVDGISSNEGDGRLSGASLYDAGDIMAPNLPFILPIDDAGTVPGAQGLDWADAKTVIENLEDPPWDYDKAVVTEDGDMYKVELEYHGDQAGYGDYKATETIEWDTSKGTLESYSYEWVWEDAGYTETTEISKGGVSEGFLEGNAPIIAIAALGIGVLALLMILIKK
ncbi:MAG: hypothetical protein Q6362_000110 [Candidatus Wukongarchaeota archaeon]|nr:hypothetical protein [Candidatus Wukongarchaeota archaeon]